MYTGKGALCKRLRVLPPGRLCAASLWSLREVWLRATKRALAASTASCAVAELLWESTARSDCCFPAITTGSSTAGGVIADGAMALLHRRLEVCSVYMQRARWTSHRTTSEGLVFAISVPLHVLTAYR